MLNLFISTWIDLSIFRVLLTGGIKLIENVWPVSAERDQTGA
jgi:hypothetical protein